MSQSIDFRINDLINEYLDYKGYRKTVETFHQERKDREEPTERQSNGKGSIDEQAKHTQGLQVSGREGEETNTLRFRCFRKNFLNISIEEIAKHFSNCGEITFQRI